MAATLSKKFSDEFAIMLDKQIRVNTSNGRNFEGKLISYNPNDYSIWLAEAKNDRGELFPKIFIAGSTISTIEASEMGPDFQKLVERLNRLFPNMVKYFREANVIVVMDRIRVSKDGVEGTGPAAERVQKVFEDFMAETTAKQTE